MPETLVPFIHALGYDIFNPAEVVPEFTADIGTKKGEKVDYAILKDGQPIITFETMWPGLHHRRHVIVAAATVDLPVPEMEHQTEPALNLPAGCRHLA